MGWVKGRKRGPRKQVLAPPSPEGNGGVEVREEPVAKTAPASTAPKTGRSWRDKHGGTSWQEKIKDPSTMSLRERAERRFEKEGWRDASSDNLFSLPQQVIDQLTENGLTACWWPETVCGAPVESLLTNDPRKYWECVQPGVIEGFDDVEKGGGRLYVRTISEQQKADEHQRREAVNRIREKEAALVAGELPGVRLDSKHPSAVGSNKIRHSYGPIPQD